MGCRCTVEHVYFQKTPDHHLHSKRSGSPRRRIEWRGSDPLNWCPNGFGFWEVPPSCPYPSVAGVGFGNKRFLAFGNAHYDNFEGPSSSCYLSNGVVPAQVSPSAHVISNGTV